MRKNGGAITIFDNGAIFIGNFNNDQINDKCVIMLEHDIYFLGTFKKGMIDGNFSIRTP